MSLLAYNRDAICFFFVQLNKGKGREYINTRQTSEAGGDAVLLSALQKVSIWHGFPLSTLVNHNIARFVISCHAVVGVVFEPVFAIS